MAERDAIVKRLDNRPGYKVVTYREVGLPVFEVSALLTLQEKSPIGALEEFVLKCIHLKLDSAAQMAAFLGLPEDLIGKQLGALVFEHAVHTMPAKSDRFALTAKGIHRLDELSTVKVTKDDIRLYVDGVTRELVPIDPTDLYSGSHLDEMGMTPVMPTPKKSPKPSDISLSAINKLFSMYAREEEEKRHAVKLHGFVRNTYLMFRPALAIGYKSDSGRDVTIAFAIDGRLSEDHEIVYHKSGAAERSAFMKDLFDSTKRRTEIQAANKQVQELMPGLVEGARQRPPADAVDAKGRKVLSLKVARVERPGSVRTLSVYDHPPLMEQAFATATSRILLISPWIRSQVVNKSFLERLEACLGRKVEVTIAYGIGKVDKGERHDDATAREKLEKLGTRYKNFRLIRKGNTHAKVLLVDDRYFVTTSFNWLSFRGDPAQPMREEEGTYVEGADLVNEYHKKLTARLVDRE